MEFGGEPDPRRPGPHRNEVQQPAAPRLVEAGQGGPLQRGDHPLADGSGVGQLLQAAGVLADAGDAKGAALGPDTDGQQVVGLLPGQVPLEAAAAHDAAVHVERRRRRGGTGRGAAAADRLDDGAELDRADGSTGQQRGVEEVVAPADDGDIVDPQIDPLEQAEGGEAGPEDQDTGAADEGPMRGDSLRGQIYATGSGNL